MTFLFRSISPWLSAGALLLLLGLAGCASAQSPSFVDPPGRVATLSWREGGVLFAPAGESGWRELPLNRPLTQGERLWTDRGARAELHLGAATLHAAGETHLGVTELDDDEAQFVLMQGVLNARVRQLDRGENVEVDTPHVAFRALQPGDYRIEVDPDGSTTQVLVRSGEAALFGEGGQSLRMGAGQYARFAGRALAQVGGPWPVHDAFDAWVAERNQLEDRSIAARYLPRHVVGYSQLDAWGNWVQDPGYGPVWYPRVPFSGWAPYRYGHWDWIAPWGWTWVDDAPWGFAPFHYGRWALIGSRWGWVPGTLGPRPVYAPALVVFLGGSSGGTSWSLSIGSGPGVAWYPLAPGEAWWPTYRTSPRYRTFVNRGIPPDRIREPAPGQVHVFRQRPEAVTGVRIDDFRAGRPVHERWRPVAPADVGRAPIGALPPRPQAGAAVPRVPGLQAAPPAVIPAVPGIGPGREPRDRIRTVPPPRPELRGDEPWAPRPLPEVRGQPDRERLQREQERQQQEAAERARREQERAARDAQRAQQEQVQRAQREQAMREAIRQQQENDRAQAARAQQERAQREQAMREAIRQQQENDRAQAARAQQERAQREQAMREAIRQQQEQDRARRESPPPGQIRAAPPAPPAGPPAAAPIGRDDRPGRGRDGDGPPGRERREGEDPRGRGQRD